MAKVRKIISSDSGFTLVELMITTAIASLVMASIYMVYRSQQKSYVIQDQVTVMQQDLRAGMYYMQNELRMAGCDPTSSGTFGITDIRLKDINNAPDVAGFSTITFTADDNLDDVVDATDGNGVLDANETFSYSIFDSPNTSGMDLGRTAGGVQDVLSENIISVGFAYAYDTNGDGQLETSPNGNIIWAIDSNNDNVLDVNLDTDDDGDIDANDNAAGTALPSSVNLADIRAVRIWMLARSLREDNEFSDNKTYVVANQRIIPSQTIPPTNGFRHRLLTTTVKFRNL